MASTGGSPRSGAARSRAAPTAAGSTRPLGTRRSTAAAGPDPLTAGLEVWASVVRGLQSARYAEVGTEYAKLSALLVQQRAAEALAGTPLRPEWAELSRAAQQVLDALEPLLGAARLLADLPGGPTLRARRPTTRTAKKPSPAQPTPTS
jgi:hypothetical protein